MCASMGWSAPRAAFVQAFGKHPEDIGSSGRAAFANPVSCLL